MNSWYESHLTKPWMKKYFSFEGRIGRKSYILRTLLVNVLSNVIRFPLGVLHLFNISLGAFYYMAYAMNIITFLLFMLSTFSLWVRRLHDLDKEGKYLIRVNMALSLAAVLFSISVVIAIERDINSLFAFIRAILPYEMYFIIALIPWMLYTTYWGILCVFKKGTEGPNRFGEDPLAPAKTGLNEGK